MLLAAALAWVTGAVVAGDPLLLLSGALVVGVALALLWLTRWSRRG